MTAFTRAAAAPSRPAWWRGLLALAGVAALCAPARAELVVLVGGHVLKVTDYRVAGDRVRLALASGGELELSLMRIERIVDDEIVAAAEEPGEVVAPPPRIGFADGDPVPETPYGELIFAAARRHRLNPLLVAAVVRAESAFDPTAVSDKGAAGLLQLMPATADRFGLTPAQRFDPELNLEAGTRYLAWLAERFPRDLPRILAGYNAGEATVERYGGVPPFRETATYIRRVYSFLGAAEAR